MSSGLAPVASEVFVLGAGFSKAVSPRIPLTDELGNECLRRLELEGVPGLAAGQFTSGRFEKWLSRLSEPQPYLTEAENLANQSIFWRLVDAISAVLGDALMEALAEPWKPWLPALLRYCHAHRCTIITLNYDLLVEAAIWSAAITGSPAVNVASILGHVPSIPIKGGMLGSNRVDTFRLLKLHGSLNWYWVPGDISGATVSLGPERTTFGEPTRADPERLREDYPGRSPFIVPPSSSKSTYFRNPITRQLWVDAASAIRSARKINLLGYSMPVEDTTFNGMLAAALATGGPREVAIADIEPELVSARFKAECGSTHRVSTFRGLNSIPDLVASRVDEWSARAAEELAHYDLATFNVEPGLSEPDNVSVVITTDSFLHAAVLRLEKIDRGLTLWCGPVQESVSAVFDDIHAQQDRVSLAQVIAAAQDVTSVRASLDGEMYPIVGLDDTSPYTIRTTLRYFALLTSETPRLGRDPRIRRSSPVSNIADTAQ